MDIRNLRLKVKECFNKLTEGKKTDVDYKGLFTYVTTTKDGKFSLTVYTRGLNTYLDFRESTVLSMQEVKSNKRVEEVLVSLLDSYDGLYLKKVVLDKANSYIAAMYDSQGFDNVPFVLVYGGKGVKPLSRIWNNTLYLNVDDEGISYLLNYVGSYEEFLYQFNQDELDFLYTAPNILHLLCYLYTPLCKFVRGMLGNAVLSVNRLLRTYNSFTHSVIEGTLKGLTYTTEKRGESFVYVFYERNQEGLHQVLPYVDVDTLLFVD